MVQGISRIPVQASYGFKDFANAASGAKARGEVRTRAEDGGVAGSRSREPELTAEELRQLRQLQAADRQVRAHEQAHISVGGDLVRGGATFTFAIGPDEKRYAVAGEVSIDTSSGRTPEETIPKAQHIRSTALAPADPSPQDRSVAATATQMESSARRELAASRSRAASEEQGDGAARAYAGVKNGGLIRLGEILDVFA